MKRALAFGALLLLACGNDKPPVKTADPVNSAAVPSASAAESASVAPAASSAPATSASVAPAAPPKGKITAFAVNANSGKVDKVGDKDGNFKADGVKDNVFDLEYEGAGVKAIFVMATDKDGALTSEFDADTIVGDANIPKEIAGILNQGKHTYGLGVYEADKLNNAKDGALTPLADGKHKLTLYISAKDFPKSPYVAIVQTTDGSLVKSAVLMPK